MQKSKKKFWLNLHENRKCVFTLFYFENYYCKLLFLCLWREAFELFFLLMQKTTVIEDICVTCYFVISEPKKAKNLANSFLLHWTFATAFAVLCWIFLVFYQKFIGDWLIGTAASRYEWKAVESVRLFSKRRWWASECLSVSRTPHAPFKTKHWLTHAWLNGNAKMERIELIHPIRLSFYSRFWTFYLFFFFLRISCKIELQTIVRFTIYSSKFCLNYLIWPFLFQFDSELQNFKFCANNANCIFLTVFRDCVVPFALRHNIKWSRNSSIWSKQPARWAPFLFQF